MYFMDQDVDGWDKIHIENTDKGEIIYKKNIIIFILIKLEY